MADPRKPGFVPFGAPSGGVLVVFAEEGVRFGPRTRSILGSAARTGHPRRQDRPFHRQGGQRARYRGARGHQGCAAGRDRDRESRRPQASGPRKARRQRNGSHSVRRDRSDSLARTRRWGAQARCRRRCRTRRDAARLFVRPLQDQAQGGGRSAEQGARVARGRRRGGRAQGLGWSAGSRRRRDHRARPRQRAAEYPLSGRVRAPRERAAQARRRHRHPRREGDAQARHGRAARRWAGLRAREPHRRDALERRQEGNAAARLHRQGRVLRYWRHFDQAGRRHGRHERRHGGRGLRGRLDACAGRPQGQDQCNRRDRSRREHAGRKRAAPGRHRDLDVGPDHRDHQHRCRRPARACGRLSLHQHALQAEIHGRSRDA